MTWLKEIILFNFLLIVVSAESQSHSLQLKLFDCPHKEITLFRVIGDNFKPIDTLNLDNGYLNYLFTNSFTGVYRLILGQTTYAKIMNESPQQLDFIYNGEDIVLETDFKHPFDSLKVIQSEENRIWHEFLKKETKIIEKIKLAEMELDYARKTANSFEVTKRIEEYNQLQKHRDSLISAAIEEHPDFYVSKLIAMHREPFLNGNFPAEKRKEIFHEDYFKQLDFTDELLMNSSAYDDVVFKYLMSFARKGLTREEQEKEFMEAVDQILEGTNKNQKVYEFVLDYLVRGFEKLNLSNVITYIADNYSETTCQTDEYTTLERKLTAQKMKPGMEVPDFTLNDMNGDPVTISNVLKKQNLLIFWASWCPHCNEMIPQILKWQKSLKSTDFQVIAVSLDDVKKEWKDKVFEIGMESWYNLSSLKKWDCPVVLDYNVYATPTIFVVDKELMIIAKPENLNELRNLFKNH